MLLKAIKVRLYPTQTQEVLLAQNFGCARWWWNFALNKSIETYKETGKGCRAKFPRFKSKHGKQSIQCPQNVKVEDSAVKLPGKIGTIQAKMHRPIEGTIKTVTVSKNPSGKHYASILIELEGEHPIPSTEGRVIGVDLGLKHLAITIDRWFPSSKLCSNCYYQIDELPLDIREWDCPHCGTHHDRDGNAATNIRAEGIRMLQADGTAVSADGGEVRPRGGRKSVLRHSLKKSEALGVAIAEPGVVHVSSASTSAQTSDR